VESSVRKASSAREFQGHTPAIKPRKALTTDAFISVCFFIFRSYVLKNAKLKPLTNSPPFLRVARNEAFELSIQQSKCHCARGIASTALRFSTGWNPVDVKGLIYQPSRQMRE
jgi:hypothetical protein